MAKSHYFSMIHWISLGHSYRSVEPACTMFSWTNNVASKSIILSCIIFLYEKLQNYSIQSSKECLFFVFCFCFLLFLLLYPIGQIKSTQKFIYALKAFPIISFNCNCNFNCKTTWYLSKVNKKFKTERAILKIYFLKFCWLKILCTLKIMKLNESLSRMKLFQFVISNTQFWFRMSLYNCLPLTKLSSLDWIGFTFEKRPFQRFYKHWFANTIIIMTLF